MTGNKVHDIVWEWPKNAEFSDVKMVIQRYNSDSGQFNGTAHYFDYPSTDPARTVSNVGNDVDRWRAWFEGHNVFTGEVVRSQYAVFKSRPTSWGHCEVNIITSGSDAGEWPASPIGHSGATLTLQSTESGKFATREGTKVKQSNGTSSASQQFTMEHTAGGYFRLKNQGSCVAHAPKSTPQDLFMYPCGYNQQEWRIVPVWNGKGGGWKLVTKDNQVLDLPGFSHDDVALQTHSQHTNDSNQTWRIQWITAATANTQQETRVARLTR
ncbi:RICIN domain-containing protein [Streptomyces sp. NPDC052040]|uniref:RICIN domain-containing protein n=1 Tax=Streptomyces sp. NPDC052040 TaxID=3365682 RepID=UPI0037D3861F